MKVLCVQKAVYHNNRRSNPNDHQPQENEIYNVVGEFYWCNVAWYILEEFGPNECFAPEMFVPISEIDEVKVYNDRFTEEGLW